MKGKVDWRTCLGEKLIQTELIHLSRTVKAKARCRWKGNDCIMKHRKYQLSRQRLREPWQNFLGWMGVDLSFNGGRINGGNYLVKRIDRSAPPFDANSQELTRFGLHDSEGKPQAWKWEEFKKMKNLMNVDENSLFRVAAAREVYGNQEQY